MITEEDFDREFIKLLVRNDIAEAKLHNYKIHLPPTLAEWAKRLGYWDDKVHVVQQLIPRF